MELHSPVMAKKLRNFIRITFFMMRKGLISKRKLIMDMNLMMKRGKLLGKSLGKNLLFHYHHHHSKSYAPRGGGFGLQEYEFSCSNSPNPVFFHVGGGAKRKHHHYFPCINISTVEESDEPTETPRPVIVLPKIEYSPQYSFDLAVGEKVSPLLLSPFSVRVSNYSDDDDDGDSGRQEVDDEAEEFIRMFYEQLKTQSRVALLEYQEMEYQEMLARGMR